MTSLDLQGIEADDQFTFNDEFTSKFKRIKVPLISAKEISSHEGGGAGEGGNGGDAGAGDGLGGEALPAAVEEERRHHVEAAIVRIMKSRKTLSHNELVMETTRQLSMRFTPNPQVGTVLHEDVCTHGGPHCFFVLNAPCYDLYAC